MHRRSSVVKAVFATILLACMGHSDALRAQQKTDPAVAELGEGFSSNIAEVNGTALHYVRGGKGPAVILLHGFPNF